jgi:hypothetical protein
MALPRVLVAATTLAMRAIEQSLGSGVALLRAATLDDALKLLDKEAPELVIVGYHFEQARALLRHLQERLREQRLPIVLVRVLSLPLAEADENDIRVAYKPFGVDEFVSLYDDEQRLGHDGAVKRLRSIVFTRLAAE